MLLVLDVATLSPLLRLPKLTVLASSYLVVQRLLRAVTVPLLASVILPLFFFFLLVLTELLLVLVACCWILFLLSGLAGVTNSVHSYDVLTRKWTRHELLLLLFFDLLQFWLVLWLNKKIKSFEVVKILISDWIVLLSFNSEFNQLANRLLPGLRMLLLLLALWLYFRWLEE